MKKAVFFHMQITVIFKFRAEKSSKESENEEKNMQFALQFANCTCMQL